MRKIGLATMCALALAATAVPEQAWAGFVQRSGTNLTLDGQTWRFVGHNNYQLTSMSGGHVCGRAISQSTLDSILQDAKNSGATVIRTWFFQSYYQANGWTAFDRVLNSAAAKGLKVIPVLVNEWQDCEPPSINKNHGFYSSAYKSPGFGYPLSFKNYATTVAQHYASNQTIAFWQLVNEAESIPPSGSSCDTYWDDAGRDALRAFADDMTNAIKAVDPNHLVSLGTIGNGQCGHSGGRYKDVHAGAIDMCEIHDYDTVKHSIPGDQWNGMQVRINQCNELGKPLVIGEAAVVADVNDSGGSGGSINADTLDRRSGFIDSKMTAAFQNGIDGYVLWEKIPDASNSSYNLNNGRFGIGPSSLFNDRTNTVTAAQATAFGAEAGSLRHGWEDPTGNPLEGWSVVWSSNLLSLSNSATQAWGGRNALALNLCCGSGYPAIRSNGATGAGGGTVVTYHVYRPSGAPSSVQVKPLATDANWSHQFGPDTNLRYGWNTIKWTIPAGIPTPLKGIGIQANNGGGWAGSIYLDDVRW